MTASAPDLDVYAALTEIVDSEVGAVVRWYQSHKSRPRIFFRGTTVTVIALGSSLPLLSLYGTSSVRLASGAIGAAISLLTALQGTFRWDQRWRVFSVAQTRLEAALAEWKAAMALARARSGGDGIDAAARATEMVLELAREIQEVEMMEFFRLDRPTTASQSSS